MKEARKNADRRAKQKWLQMPPVMSPRTKESRVLDRDPAIQGKIRQNMFKHKLSVEAIQWPLLMEKLLKQV